MMMLESSSYYLQPVILSLVLGLRLTKLEEEDGRREKDRQISALQLAVWPGKVLREGGFCLIFGDWSQKMVTKIWFLTLLM